MIVMIASEHITYVLNWEINEFCNGLMCVLTE